MADTTLKKSLSHDAWPYTPWSSASLAPPEAQYGAQPTCLERNLPGAPQKLSMELCHSGAQPAWHPPAAQLSLVPWVTAWLTHPRVALGLAEVKHGGVTPRCANQTCLAPQVSLNLLQIYLG